MKKFISVLLIIATCISMLSIQISASEYNDDTAPNNESSTTISNNNYIRFDDSRISSNGHFTFEFNYRLTSGRFTANSTSITICTKAHLRLYDGYGTTTTSNTDLFRLTLMKYGVICTAVGEYIGAADNIYGGKTFYGITPGSQYFFILTPVDENFHLTAKHFEGYGDVSNVTVN